MIDYFKLKWSEKCMSDKHLDLGITENDGFIRHRTSNNRYGNDRLRFDELYPLALNAIDHLLEHGK